MNRLLIHFLVVVLLALQTLAISSSPLLDANALHCNDSAMKMTPSDCCTDACTTDSCFVGCAVHYSVFAVPTALPSLVVPSPDQSSVFVASTALTPKYTPLNPPPIA
jgi:hypothetical protein